MPWSEIGVVAVTLLMVRGWRRSKRSGRAVPNSQRFNQSSPLTGQNPNSLVDADPAMVAHDSRCENCGVQVPVPVRVSRLERRPWRLVWWCRVCGRQSRALVRPEMVPMLVGWDRVGGTSLSLREVAEMVDVDLDELNQAVEDELDLETPLGVHAQGKVLVVHEYGDQRLVGHRLISTLCVPCQNSSARSASSSSPPSHSRPSQRRIVWRG